MVATQSESCEPAASPRHVACRLLNMLRLQIFCWRQSGVVANPSHRAPPTRPDPTRPSRCGGVNWTLHWGQANCSATVWGCCGDACLSTSSHHVTRHLIPSLRKHRPILESVQLNLMFVESTVASPALFTLQLTRNTTTCMTTDIAQ